MNVTIYSLMAEVDPSIQVVTLAEERASYVFKLFARTLFGKFESPAAAMFADKILFLDDGKSVSAVDAELVLKLLYKRLRKVDDASI